MGGRPVFDGAVQLTDRLVVLFKTDDTTGAAGVSGGSSTSVRLMVTAMVALASAVRGLHRHRVRQLRLIVVGHAGFGLDLSGSRDDREGGRFRPFKSVGQHVAGIVVGGGDRCSDIGVRGAVLRHAARRAAADKYRYIVAGVTGAGLRPVTVALGVGRPHMDLIGGVRGETGNCRARAGHVLRPVCPASAHALPVLQVVAGNGRAARVRWCGPAYRQARCAVQDRRHHRRGGRQRRLVHIRQVDGHRNGGARRAVRGLHRYRIGRPGFVIIDDAGPRPDLAAVPVDGEITRISAPSRL